MRFRIAILTCLALALLSGCTAAKSGVVGSTLVREEYPGLAMKANPPLILQGYGRQWVSLPTDFVGTDPTGKMDYAVYGEGGEGPLTRHAHVFVVRPSNDDTWRFQPESYPAPGGLAIGKQNLGGRTWVAQITRVNGETDWFSAMWRESGREVPELWIARRFSATPERATRVVAEYREPWPECLDPEAKDLSFVRESCLGDFIERSNAAFTLNLGNAAPEEMEDASGPTPASVLVKPSFAPDMKRLAGELREEDRSMWRWR